jgi:nicotinamide-nucleotide amidase
MRVEIINTGTELLLGRVVNTHLQFLAQSLIGLGLRVDWQVTVPDGVAIAEALEMAMARADLILITGGLGPTSDDITREAAAEAFGRKLIFHREIMDGIATKFSARKIILNEDQQRPQAMVPEGGVVLDNPRGTAPGLIIENDQTVAVLRIAYPPFTRSRCGFWGSGKRACKDWWRTKSRRSARSKLAIARGRVKSICG